MNTKGLQMKFKILAALSAAQLLTAPLWAAESNQSGGEAIETLAIFGGSNGANPGNIIQGSHGDFYGTTYTGGTYDKGTVFEIPLNKQVVTLVNFNGTDGASPDSHIVQAPDGTFYGTTREGGTYNKGTVFSFTHSTFHTLVSFSGINGDTPAAGLLRGADGRFYGTTTVGGAGGHGTIFALSTNGTLQTLASFSGANGSSPGPLLRGTDGNLYGMTSEGGAMNDGTIFRYTPGGQVATIFTFDGANGANPHDRLSQLPDGTFFGTTTNGGANNLGTVFSFTLNKSEAQGSPRNSVFLDVAYTPGAPLINFHSLLSFNGTNGSHPSSALVPWSNGYFFMERLWDNLWIKSSTVQWSGVNLSGTTSGGGSSGHGTAFQISEDGTLTTLLTFDGTQGRVLGTIPNSLTPGDDGDLYGTTYYGGPSNGGTVFRILLNHVVPASGGGFNTPPLNQTPNSQGPSNGEPPFHNQPPS
jgi:uncharacterized repeat protein (TIGR03803 family)